MIFFFQFIKAVCTTIGGDYEHSDKDKLIQVLRTIKEWKVIVQNNAVHTKTYPWLKWGGEEGTKGRGRGE